jgi:hypothetical protein
LRPRLGRESICPVERPPDPRVGLCSVCKHARQIQSARGSSFYLCGRASTDSRFHKYPPLPVVACPGFEPDESD